MTTRSMALVMPALLTFAGLAQAQFEYSVPFEGPGDPRVMVQGWYAHYLGREIDPGALFWIHDLQMGYSAEQVLSTILSSQEYLARAGGTQAGLVQRLYVDIAGRKPTEAELKYWQGRMRFDSVQDVAYKLLSRNPQDWADSAGPAAPYFRKSTPKKYEYRRRVQTIVVTPRK